MGSRKALVVGIDDYPFAPLNGCVNDAKEMAALLSRNGDGSVNFSVQIKTSKDYQIEKGPLRKWIQDCFSGDDEIALFYFSGHGHIDPIGGYIVTSDYTSLDYGVSMQDILSFANQSKCQNKIIILDCCHAGSLGTISTTGPEVAVVHEGVTILTASEWDKTAEETNGHGVFTNLLMEALNGGAADVCGRISPGSVYAFIDRALGPWGQRPIFKTNVKTFVSLREVEAPIEIEIIRRLPEYFSEPEKKLQLDPSFEPTNNDYTEHKIIEPYSKEENTKVFQDLQKLESVGLVVPEGSDHMYYAAMESKYCKLTATGRYYWKLVSEDRI